MCDLRVQKTLSLNYMQGQRRAVFQLSKAQCGEKTQRSLFSTPQECTIISFTSTGVLEDSNKRDKSNSRLHDEGKQNRWINQNKSCILKVEEPLVFQVSAFVCNGD